MNEERIPLALACACQTSPTYRQLDRACPVHGDDAERARRGVAAAERPAVRSDRGFGLIEVLICMTLVGVLLVPVTQLLVVTMRTTAAAERAAVRLGVASSVSSIASRAVLVDECDSSEYSGAVAARGITIPAGWTMVVEADCSAVPTVLLVSIEDSAGGLTELLGVRG